MDKRQQSCGNRLAREFFGHVKVVFQIRHRVIQANVPLCQFMHERDVRHPRDPRRAAKRDLAAGIKPAGDFNPRLHLALSTNGYQWQALNGDRAFLKPQVGADKIMRNPCLAEGPDGTFHLVWTSGGTAEKGKIIGYARSKDLVAWSQQQAIPLMENEPNTRNIWAPEISFNKSKAQWLVFWSSTIPGRYPESDSTGDDGYNYRFYCVTPSDFKTFAESRLLYDPGFNAIDRKS